MYQPSVEGFSAKGSLPSTSTNLHPEKPKLAAVDPPTYSFDEASEASLAYFGGDPLAANVWVTKYALQDKQGRYLERTPTDMHHRLAREFARIEAKYPNPMSEAEIFDLLDRFRYIVPQGSPMSGIGNTNKIQSISNCFVISAPHDSYGGILWTDQEQVQIMKRRGGVGMDISTIRPQGLPTANAANTTDGIGVFMERFSNSCREVAQGGRRGALMLTLDVHHPDIRTFITIKKDKMRVTGANISLRLSDEFMEAVKEGKQVQLRYPVDAAPGEYDVERWVDANELWTEIIESAHQCAEPGLLFWDNAKKNTPSDLYSAEGFGSTSTNPCGEIILSPNDSCRLMVVNLSSFVQDSFGESPTFDWATYGAVVRKAQRLMDDMIDLEIEQVDKILAKIADDPEPDEVKHIERRLWLKIRDAAERGRRTGLGVTAVGDACAQMNLVYGSDDSIEFIEDCYRHLAKNSYQSSIEMAAERGAFPVFDIAREADHPFLARVFDELDEGTRAAYRQYGRRNIANTTTAPCGSVSILTQTTSGIEPAYLLQYTRRKKVNPNDENAQVDFVDDLGDEWTHFPVLHHQFAEWCKVTGRDVDEVLGKLTRTKKVNGKDTPDPDLSDVEQSPYWKATSNDVDWVQKVTLQGAAQRWICHAISNTTNLPADIDVETVKQVYEKGHEVGCKGVTIYVQGSRDGVLVSEEAKPEEFDYNKAPKRPDKLACDIHRSRVKGDDGEYVEWMIFVGLMNGKPFEVFGGIQPAKLRIPKKVKSGWIVKRSFKDGGKYDLHFGDEDDPMVIEDLPETFDNPTQGSFTRILSYGLRHGGAPQYAHEQLLRERDSDMFHFAKVLGRVLKNYIEDGTKASTRICKGCGAEDSLIYQEGCPKCSVCGAQKCG